MNVYTLYSIKHGLCDVFRIKYVFKNVNSHWRVGSDEDKWAGSSYLAVLASLLLTAGDWELSTNRSFNL